MRNRRKSCSAWRTSSSTSSSASLHGHSPFAGCGRKAAHVQESLLDETGRRIAREGIIRPCESLSTVALRSSWPHGFPSPAIPSPLFGGFMRSNLRIQQEQLCPVLEVGAEGILQSIIREAKPQSVTRCRHGQARFAMPTMLVLHKRDGFPLLWHDRSESAQRQLYARNRHNDGSSCKRFILWR